VLTKEDGMIKKFPILPERIRKVPRHFSWVDHRLVRDRYIERCSYTALALYLFLVTVGDAKGLSYYADVSIIKRLSMDQAALEDARNNLIRIGLIAWHMWRIRKDGNTAPNCVIETSFLYNHSIKKRQVRN